MEYKDKPPISDLVDELFHYGMPRRSGRYPWGSGEDPYQHEGDWLSRVKELRDQGLSEPEIVKAMNLNSSTELRAYESLAKDKRKTDLYYKAKSMKEDGKTNEEIAEALNLKGESSVRSLLNSYSEDKLGLATKTAANLKNIVDKSPHGMIDVGEGVDAQLNISKEKLEQALIVLEAEGYHVYGGRVPQVTNKGQWTTRKVLATPDKENKDIFDYEKVSNLNDYISHDDGETIEHPAFQYPASLDSKRLQIRYAEDGGTAKDGLIEIRRNVPDLSLGESRYSQVRILVDGTHFIKGMAVYGDDMPEGVDIIFNSNKSKEKGMYGALKEIKDDPENPFGSYIKEHGGQSYYDDPNGTHIDPVTGNHQSLSLINKRADQGDWDEWSHNLPSQFLSKQPKSLIKNQLELAASEKEDEFNDILELTNPTIKKKMLESFAEDCDSAAVYLKAAALPRQRYQVILPLTSIKDNEIFAPNYNDGEEVVLIRYPHGGTFEIPRLTVNNRNEEALRVIGNNAPDAVGINKAVADRLSGADFDGDTVMVIPVNRRVDIKSTPPLKDLEGFDPKIEYGTIAKKDPTTGETKYYSGGNEIKIMSKGLTQTEMGIISNLITDMTLKGAPEEDIAKAVKHSMVVIDAEKHKLDYKRSEVENDIAYLHKKYQGNERGGASTLISKAKGVKEVPERKDGIFISRENGKELTEITDSKSNTRIYVDDNGEIYYQNQKKTLPINPDTGEKLYRNTGRVYYTATIKDENGKSKRTNVVYKDGNYLYKNTEGVYVELPGDAKVKENLAKQKSTKMYETKDARELSSGKIQEELYADYANKMKSLANEARKIAYNTEGVKYSAAANKAFKDEVDALDYQLSLVTLNKPKERQAQAIAASKMKLLKKDNPSMTKEEEAKYAQRLLTSARATVGAKRNEINISDKQWSAIQAGAVSNEKLSRIIDASNKDRLKQLATPRTNKTTLSNAKINRIKQMSSSGYTNAEIADQLGVSASTIVKYLKSNG